MLPHWLFNVGVIHDSYDMKWDIVITHPFEKQKENQNFGQFFCISAHD